MTSDPPSSPPDMHTFYNVQERFFDQYGNLLYSIAHQTYLKGMEFLDLVQELVLKTYEVVKSYAERFGDQSEEFWLGTEFGKYYKSCIWNKRSTLVSKDIKQREKIPYSIDYGHSVEDNEELELNSIIDPFDIQDNRYPLNADIFFALPELDENERKLVKIILEHDVTFENGDINIQKLSEIIGLSRIHTVRWVEILKEKLAVLK